MQRELEIQRRHERVVELRGLDGERHRVNASIVEVSAEMVTAKRASMRQQPRQTLEEIRAQARENWLAFKAAKEGPELSAEERQREAREQWLESRQGKSIGGNHAQESEQKAESEREKKHQQKHDYGLDDDFSM